MFGSGSCFLLPSTQDCKVITPFLLKCKRHGCRFKKRQDLNSTTVAVFGFLFTIPTSFRLLFTALASFDLTAAAGFLSIANLAAASALDGNSIRNCVDFLQF